MTTRSSHSDENQARMLEILEQLRRNPAESATVEFKSNLSEPKAIGEYLSALANSAALEGQARPGWCGALKHPSGG